MYVRKGPGTLVLRPRTLRLFTLLTSRQFRREFVSLALVTHHFESPLGLFVSSRDFRLYLGGSLFHLWREAHVAVVLHAGSGRDKASDNDVLFQAAQVIDLAVNASFGEHSRGLLERRGGDERVGRKRSLRDPEEQRPPSGRLAALRNHALVFFPEGELVDLLFEQEARIAHIFHLHPAHHLANNHFDVLVADVHALEPVDFLDFVHQVSLQLFLAEHGQDVVRVERSVHKRFARLDALAFLHVDVHATRNRVFFLGAIVGDHIDLALSLRNLAELDRAIDFADDRGFMRLAGFEQLNHTRQTTSDVFGLGGFARDLCKHIARSYGVSILDHQVRARGHQVSLAGLPALDDDRRLALLVGRVADHMTRQAGNFVDFFMKRDAFL